MRARAYPRTKPSGVEWLGDVPEHWELKRLKLTVRHKDTKTTENEEYPVPYVGLENVESWTGRLLPIDPDVVPSGAANTFELGDTLFGKLRPYLAKACNPSFSGLCSTELLVLQGIELAPDALLYVLLSDGFIKLVDSSAYGTKMPRADWEAVGNSIVPVPPLFEQRLVVSFVDAATKRLDLLIAQKRELIARLQEKRVALISQAVTRGLEPGVNLKPSGIEWLGVIPEHWGVKRLKFELSGIEQGWSPQCDNSPADDDEWGVLKAGAVNGTEFDPTENKRLPDEETPLPEYEIRPGDFLVSRANTRSLLGSAGIVRHTRPRLLLCDKLYRLTLRTRALNAEYLLRFMRSVPGHYEFERDASGSSASMQNIGQESVRNLWVPLPPLAEQAEIVTWLDAELTSLDQLMAKVEMAIEHLREYRSAIITAAVTGKIDLREGADAS